MESARANPLQEGGGAGIRRSNARDWDSLGHLGLGEARAGGPPIALQVERGATAGAAGGARLRYRRQERVGPHAPAITTGNCALCRTELAVGQSPWYATVYYLFFD